MSVMTAVRGGAAGYEPSTLSRSARRSQRRQRPRHARLAACPTRSRKKTYSQGRPCSGRDSIVIRSMPWVANGRSTATARRPRRHGQQERRLVVAASARSASSRPSTRKRVTLSGSSWMPRRATSQADSARRRLGRRSPPCRALRGGAARRPRVARHLARSGRPADGRASHCRHCASDCGCETTRRIGASAVPGRASRQWRSAAAPRR